MIKNKKGFTLVELIVVIALIGMIGTMVFTLVGAGRNQSRIINENFDAQGEARIAMAFITTTLRQNDISGGVSVFGHTSDGVTVGQRLFIRNSSGKVIKIISFDSANKELKFTDGVPKVIAKIDSISFSQDEDKKSVSITIDYGNDKHLNSTITLRSE